MRRRLLARSWDIEVVECTVDVLGTKPNGAAANAEVWQKSRRHQSLDLARGDAPLPSDLYLCKFRVHLRNGRMCSAHRWIAVGMFRKTSKSVMTCSF